MAVNDPHFKIRLPVDLKTRLEAAAVDNARSVTAEIVHRLQESFEVERLLPEGLDAVEARAQEQTESLARMSAQLDEISRLIAAGPPGAKGRRKP